MTDQTDPHNPLDLLPPTGLLPDTDPAHRVPMPHNAVPLHDWGYYYGGGFDTPVAVVREYLGTDASGDEVVGITRAYRAAMNRAISHHGVYLRGAQFYARPRDVDTAEDVITQAIEHVDLKVVADRYDQDPRR